MKPGLGSIASRVPLEVGACNFYMDVMGFGGYSKPLKR